MNDTFLTELRQSYPLSSVKAQETMHWLVTMWNGNNNSSKEYWKALVDEFTNDLRGMGYSERSIQRLITKVMFTQKIK